jgi:predicted transcriptional regulator
MLGALVLIVLIFLPSILALTAWSSQADIVEGLENRHTPGFPGILNISSVDDLLKISSPDVRRALERILECDTLECVEQDELSSRIIQSILYNSTGLNVYDLRNMSYRPR